MKKALSIVLTLILTICAANTTFLYSASALDENSDEYKYVFSERNYDEFQLTDAQLKSDTPTLLNFILESQFINPLVANISDYSVYQNIVKQFNGLQELERRTDAGKTMVQQYMEECVKGDYTFKGDQLYVLLIQDIYKSKLTPREMNTIRVIDECLYYKMLHPDVVAYATQSTIVVNNITYTSNGYVQTLSGTNVQSWLATRELNAGEIASANALRDYHSVTQLASPTSKYNCHSYAWHSNSISNTNWIMSPNAFKNDSQCTAKAFSAAQAYDTVIYFDSSDTPTHSGIVKSVSNGTLTIRSKWGAAGVYVHDLENVPPNYIPDNGSYACVYSYHGKYTYISKNAAQHTRKCGICGKSTVQNHVANSTGTGCRYCNYTGTIGGVASDPGDLETN